MKLSGLDDQHGENRVGLELLDCVAVRSQGHLDIRRGRVAYAELDLLVVIAENARLLIFGPPLAGLAALA